MKVHIPHSAFLGNLDGFLKGFDPNNSELLELTLNKKWIFVHPAVLAMIAALGLKAKKVTCEKIEATSGHYLERMGLFNFLKVPSGLNITEHDASGRFIPLTQIRNSAELSKFITEMIPLLHLDPKQVEPIRYVISELVRNVLEHSQSKYGAIVAAQYFAKSNKIKVGIADTGFGIQKTINWAYPEANEKDAIALALTPGITGTTRKEGGTDYNAGAGLFFIKSIAQVNRDFFVLYSGGTMYKLLKRKPEKNIFLHADPLLDRHSIQTDMPYLQGTLVGIDISLEETTEFTFLLEHINMTYSEAVRQRKKAIQKRPKFI